MKKQLLCVIKELLEEAMYGFIQKPQKSNFRKNNLSNDAYEKKVIVYRAKPIPHRQIKK